MSTQPEVWMRGPVEGIPPLLQPVAHALLEATEEVERFVSGFPDAFLWKRPAGVASVGFHLQHFTGVLDRLVTYANGNSLTEEQLNNLKQEGKETNVKTEDLVRQFKQKVQETLDYLKTVNEKHLADYRPVGRKQLPSTVIGLLFHAAEHTMRHVGQLLVTVKVVKANDNQSA